VDANETTRRSGGLLLGAIEGGGTKIECALGYSHDRVLERRTVNTGDPAATLTRVIDFFLQAQEAHGTLQALGVGFFGPLQLCREQPGYGRLLDTPKRGWSGTDLLGTLSQQIPVPIGIDTDVAAAALAEWKLGAGRGAGSVAYVTVGTGIGVGFAPDILGSSRLAHPEGGHLPVRRAPGDDHFPGVCPFHGACLEGLASGSAIRARWGRQLQSLPADHEAWRTVGFYLGQLASTIALLVPVQRIIFGGGVMSAGPLLPHIRATLRDRLNGYIMALRDATALEGYVSAAQLGADAGLAGAFEVAAAAMRRSTA
jgi:fructokinase